jgi:hypothetical protein
MLILTEREKGIVLKLSNTDVKTGDSIFDFLQSKLSGCLQNGGL